MSRGRKIKISRDACLAKTVRGNSHPTKQVALDETARMSLRRYVQRDLGHRFELRAFLCRWCGRWHVGKYLKSAIRKGD